MGALSPDRLVIVTPLENICRCSLTRWVGESDSTREFCGFSLTRWVGESDSTLWVLSHKMSW